MGAAVLERLVAPVATGVYSAQPDGLDVAVVAPGLNQALTRTGSLSGAVAELRSAAKAGSAVGGIRGGMWRLPLRSPGRSRRGAASSRRARPWSRSSRGRRRPTPSRAPTPTLAPRPAQTRHNASTATSERDANPPRWTVRLADGREVPADAVVLALPAEPALELLGTASPELGGLASLGWPPASSVELVTFVLDDDRLSAAPRGTGVLVADTDESGVTAKATTHSTAKWAWLAEAAGPARHVVRLSYGRAGRTSPTVDLRDEDVRALASPTWAASTASPSRSPRYVRSPAPRGPTPCPTPLWASASASTGCGTRSSRSRVSTRRGRG